MLEPKDIASLLTSSKRVNEVLSSSKVLWLHTTIQNNLKTKSTTTILKKRIEVLESEDLRFAALKTPEATQEISALIDEYIRKRKTLGESIVTIVKNCKSFITTGDVVELTKTTETKPQASSGFFGTLGGMLGFGSGEAVKTEKVQDPAVELAEIISSEKMISPERISVMLTQNAMKLAGTNQEKMNKWIMTLQKCFATLYKSLLYFYCEAKDVEKLKDFMRIRVEELTEQSSKQKKGMNTLKDQYKNCKEVIFIFICYR